ncbi:gas vesicle protein K [Nonomuraea sp. NPDC050680]|uniref:gas vesicle protein K n=1 Tax=Nonomuraea sp. NPDC050680 TaxID=3154630 RepID=UPI0033CEC396
MRIETDAEAVERDLSRLVLTLVELVRQLVERQCVRRMEQGDLSDEQIEVLGVTLMRLEEAMTEMCDRFDLSPSDLNIDLGPLGTLLPRD